MKSKYEFYPSVGENRYAEIPKMEVIQDSVLRAIEDACDYQDSCLPWEFSIEQFVDADASNHWVMKTTEVNEDVEEVKVEYLIRCFDVE